MTEVIQFNEEEPLERLLVALMKDTDMCIPVDCADPRVQFTVKGWFVCPRGSLVKPHDVTMPS